MKSTLITLNPEVSLGKPVIRGTRLTVDFILELLAGGWEVKQILKEYPQLSEEAIRGALQYATDRLRNEQTYLTPEYPSAPQHETTY